MYVKNFASELMQVSEHWSPRIVAQVNDQYVKVAKLLGEFVWHKHDDEDEMFFVLKGDLIIQYEDREVSLSEGDFHVVPKGVMHNPVAKEECHIALIEPVATKHTGDVINAKTRSIEEQQS